MQMSDGDEIHGRRTVLTALRGADADALSGLLEDPLVRGFLDVNDVDGLRRRFTAWETRRSPDGTQAWLNWVVRSREDDRALGWAQATVEGAEASVAYVLLPGERGRGAASDAVRALTAWLRATGVTDVTAAIAPENAASERVARAAGFAPTDRVDDGDRVWRQSAAGRAGP